MKMEIILKKYLKMIQIVIMKCVYMKIEIYMKKYGLKIQKTDMKYIYIIMR